MVAESVRGSVEGDDDGSVQEPVEHRGGDGRVAEDLTPGADWPVRRDYDRRFQVALVDDLEQCRAASAAAVMDRRVADGGSRIFGTCNNTPVTPANLRRAWRAALPEQLSWVTPKSARKTVLRCGETPIPKQLGGNWGTWTRRPSNTMWKRAIHFVAPRLHQSQPGIRQGNSDTLWRIRSKIRACASTRGRRRAESLTLRLVFRVHEMDSPYVERVLPLSDNATALAALDPNGPALGSYWTGLKALAESHRLLALGDRPTGWGQEIRIAPMDRKTGRPQFEDFLAEVEKFAETFPLANVSRVVWYDPLARMSAQAAGKLLAKHPRPA